MHILTVIIMYLGLVAAVRDLIVPVSPQTKHCLYVIKRANEPINVMYQTVRGNSAKIVFEVSDANRKLYEVQKNEDNYTITESHEGEYRLCFSNFYSADLINEVSVGFETIDPGHDELIKTELKPIEAQTVELFNKLTQIIKEQHYHKMQEVIRKKNNEKTKIGAMSWAVLLTVSFIVCSVFQTINLKRFLEEYRIL